MSAIKRIAGIDKIPVFCYTEAAEGAGSGNSLQKKGKIDKFHPYFTQFYGRFLLL